MNPGAGSGVAAAAQGAGEVRRAGASRCGLFPLWAILSRPRGGAPCAAAMLPTEAPSWRAKFALCTLAIFCRCACAGAGDATHVLDNFDSLAPWSADHTDDTTSSIERVSGEAGHALRLNFDFNGVVGYATARRALPLDLPANYELSFRVRGAAPLNNLQFKLVDASGENVWWLNRPDFALPHEWQQITIKKRQLAFAWGPAPDHELKHAAAVEFVISSGSGGGSGYVDIGALSIRELAPDSGAHPTPLAHVSSSVAAPAQRVFDEHGAAAWCSDPKRGAEQTFDVDLGEAREFGGLTLVWKAGFAATSYDVQFSDDRRNWRTVRRVRDGNGGSDPLLLTESQTRHVRVAMHRGEAGRYCLAHLRIENLDWGATPNAFVAALAKSAPRGSYPRGFTEQPYWTIVGVDGAAAPALLSEDGALEPVKGGFSIEPLLRVDGTLFTWADFEAAQTLRDGYLPMPRVEWKNAQVELAVEAFAAGERDASRLVATYRITNPSNALREITLALAVRPFQVNPPAQFLNSPGGVSAINDIGWRDGTLVVNGRAAVAALDAPDRFVASTFDAGSIVEQLRADTLPSPATGVLHDDTGLASGALIYHMTLAPHASREVTLVAPISGALDTGMARDDVTGWVAAQRERVANAWRERLNHVRLSLPEQARYLADTLRSAHADILMTRAGAALRPGTRSYARSWIRDGAMIADALLRLGDTNAVRDYVDWYAPHQFGDGKVPCCVDARGSDPVPENDSHGELIHAIAQLYRYGGGRAVLARQYPHVSAAIGYMDTLRAGERGAADAAFAGLLPASISHEGYSAKPMHSYWDDFWALTGYKDAVDIARALGKSDDAAQFALARDALRRDLLASIARAVKSHGIAFIPGCAELGDFDATSTTVALSPAGEQARLPQDLLHETFERYWREFEARANGAKVWEAYTPYEWRSVGAFVRLGWRERAQAALAFFFDTGARPRGWNQWAEVVGREPRRIRFIGDMPHGWVASDFIRSVLDLFAYERDDDHALVLAAGVPADWLRGEGIAVAGLRTPYGPLGYTLKQNGKNLLLHVDAGAVPPGGFVFAWPGGAAHGTTRIDGKRVRWQGAELRVAAAPANVVIETGQTARVNDRSR